MSDSNIDKFNEMVVQLFSRLYEEFPREIDVEFKELTATSDLQERRIYTDGVIFLIREKFITVKCVNNVRNRFEDVVLTSKGLSVLNSSPECLEHQITIGESITEVLKTGVKDGYSTLVQAIINGGLSIS